MFSVKYITFQSDKLFVAILKEIIHKIVERTRIYLRYNKPIVLLITHSGDYYNIDLVSQALVNRGVLPIRLNSDLFPGKISVSSYFDNEGSKYILDDNENKILLSDVRAVWLRKFGYPRIDSKIPHEYQDICLRESVAAIEGFFDGLNKVKWIDSISLISLAENKLRQLRIAQNTGLHIPATLVSNSAKEAQNFYEKSKGEVVAKLLKPVTVSMGRPDMFVYTSVVSKDDINNAENLRLCPMVFQERISVDGELRIVYVAGKCFVGEICGENNKTCKPDWRRPENSNLYWAKGEIPPELSEKIDIFMKTLGIYFGALDFIRTPDGKYVFLEVNPCGEWGMLEQELGLPISSAIADALIEDLK